MSIMEPFQLEQGSFKVVPSGRGFVANAVTCANHTLLRQILNNLHSQWTNKFEEMVEEKGMKEVLRLLNDEDTTPEIPAPFVAVQITGPGPLEGEIMIVTTTHNGPMLCDRSGNPATTTTPRNDLVIASKGVYMVASEDSLQGIAPGEIIEWDEANQMA